MAARSLLLYTHHSGSSPITFMSLGVALFGLMFCAVAMIMMCASEDEIPRKIKRQSKRFAKACYGMFDDDYYYYQDYNPTIVHYDQQQQEVVVGQVANPIADTVTSVSNTIPAASQEQQEVSGLWKKKILMGGKCQLPEFSGVIMYDSEGNLVPKKPTRLALTWK